MKILLIGYEGYVGSGLFNFLNRTHDVIGWSKKDNILNIKKDFLLTKNFDIVINCATVMDRIGSIIETDSLTHKVNIDGMKNLVSQLKNTSTKLVYISTKDIYGNLFNKENTIETDKYFKLPFYVDDDESFSPKTAYGKSKLIGEYIAESHSNHIVIRLSSCYTDYNHYRGHWVPNLIKSLKNGSDIKLTNKGKQVRDLLHVNDLGRLINLVIKSNKKGLKLNAGGGRKNIMSILQFIDHIDSKPIISNIDGDDYGFVFSNRLSKDEFNWEPEIIFSERLPIVIKNLYNNISAKNEKKN